MQLAIREGRGIAGAQRPAPQDGAAGGAAPGRQGSAAAVNGGAAAPLLPEGAEAALLYVRFRAAAEPGLKGEALKPPAGLLVCLRASAYQVLEDQVHVNSNCLNARPGRKQLRCMLLAHRRLR